MPVLINKETGLAEDLSPDLSRNAAQTHLVPLYDLDGNPVDVEHGDAASLIQKGYSQPNMQELKDMLKTAKFSSGIEQAKTGLEGIAEGMAGPLAPLAERAAGVRPEDILSRKEANPGTHTLGQISGLIGSVVSGVGQGALLEQAGKALATKLAPTLGAKAAGKIATAAARGGVENVIFQAGDETSKYIINDPAQSAESAVANVGMAGLLGAGIGGSLGAVGLGFNKLAGSKAGQFIEDFKGRLKEHIDNPEPVSAVQTELSDFYNGIKSYSDEVYGPQGLKAQELARVMPEMSPKMGEQLNGLTTKMDSAIQEMQSKPLRYPERLVGQMQEEVSALKTAIAEAKSPTELFNATQDLKQKLGAWSKFEKSVKPIDEGYQFIKKAKELGFEARNALEDVGVWGKAAERQSKINKAFTDFLPSLKDFEKKFTSEIGGERVIDPGKISTYVNQLGKANAELKQEMMHNFIDAAKKYQTVIDDTHTNLGLEAPSIPGALNHTNKTLAKITNGAKLADVFLKHNSSIMLGEGVGATVGSAVGHPFLGYVLGKYSLAPILKKILPTIIRPLLERPTSAAGLKAAIATGMEAAKGEQTLNNVIRGVFGGSMPELKVDKLEKLREHVDKVAENPQELEKVGRNVAHYMPEHAAFISQTAARNMQYLASLRPNTAPLGPLNNNRVPSKIEEANYNRALTIAQNPFTLLASAKDATLTQQDLTHLVNLYPQLHQRMSMKLMEGIIDARAKGKTIAYKTRIGISAFTGQSLDSTLTVPTIMSTQGIGMQAESQNAMKPQQTAKNVDKLGKIGASSRTIGQAREVYKTTGHR